MRVLGDGVEDGVVTEGERELRWNACHRRPYAGCRFMVEVFIWGNGIIVSQAVWALWWAIDEHHDEPYFPFSAAFREDIDQVSKEMGWGDSCSLRMHAGRLF